MTRKAKQCTQCGSEIYFDGICYKCRVENARKEILALSEKEIDEKVKLICEEINDKKDLDKLLNTFQLLLTLRDIDTSEIAKIAFENKLFYPRTIYKNCSENITDEMINMLKDDETESSTASQLLCCLSIIGGEKVFNTFVELDKNPRKWRKKLHVNPSYYAHEGGWSYDSEYNFVKTSYDVCYPIIKSTNGEKLNSPVKIMTKADGVCENCGTELINLIEINGNDKRMQFLGINGKIKATCCPNCVLYDRLFCTYEIDGESTATTSKNYEDFGYVMPKEDVETLLLNTYALGEQVPLRYAAYDDGGSSIGGFGNWIQDCELIICPDCGKPMKYLAQIEWDNLIEYYEGNAYINICTDCKKIAMLHQQT